MLLRPLMQPSERQHRLLGAEEVILAEAEAGQLSRLLPAPTAAANRESLTQ